ncbi:MAG: hypothetical protein J6M18_06010 [Actinomycetaceae bacterium]|nr:hypothetical protein [Actinomycetaceae bacterium]
MRKKAGIGVMIAGLLLFVVGVMQIMSSAQNKADVDVKVATENTRYVYSAPGVLDVVSNSVTVSVTCSDPKAKATLGFAASDQAEQWMKDLSATKITGLASWEALKSEKVNEGSAQTFSLIDSDILIDGKTNPTSVSLHYVVKEAGTRSLMASCDSSDNTGMTVELLWKQAETSHAYAVPLAVGGVLVIALGFVVFFFATPRGHHRNDDDDDYEGNEDFDGYDDDSYDDNGDEASSDDEEELVEEGPRYTTRGVPYATTVQEDYGNFMSRRRYGRPTYPIDENTYEPDVDSDSLEDDNTKVTAILPPSLPSIPPYVSDAHDSDNTDDTYMPDADTELVSEHNHTGTNNACAHDDIEEDTDEDTVFVPSELAQPVPEVPTAPMPTYSVSTSDVVNTGMMQAMRDTALDKSSQDVPFAQRIPSFDVVDDNVIDGHDDDTEKTN